MVFFQKEYNNYINYYDKVTQNEPFNIIQQRAETTNGNSDITFWYKNVDNLLSAYTNMKKIYDNVIGYIPYLSSPNVLEGLTNIKNGLQTMNDLMARVNEQMTEAKHDEIMGWKGQINGKVRNMKNRSFTSRLARQFSGNNSNLRRNRRASGKTRALPTSTNPFANDYIRAGEIAARQSAAESNDLLGLFGPPPSATKSTFNANTEGLNFSIGGPVPFKTLPRSSVATEPNDPFAFG
jgi:hypothetical protein